MTLPVAPVRRPGCRCVSHALALCLNESRECATVSANDEENVTLLLALAFPGKIRPTLMPGRGEGITAVADATRSMEHCGTPISIRDHKTRENALSCLFSIVKVIQEGMHVPVLDNIAHFRVSIAHMLVEVHMV